MIKKFEKGDLKEINKMIDSKSWFLNKDEKTKALNSIVLKSDTALTKKLLFNGVDPNLTLGNSHRNSVFKVTQLSQAVHMGNKNVVNALLQNGANPDMKVSDKDACLSFAVTSDGFGSSKYRYC